ncbi:NAD-dependent epimerase/dehydratase family protein [Cohaesibacter celericrescens]|uniref:NAD-dependent epimerase/dehydratase family protein n=1 Tax=Cohaesibacter celericrescens TaxID=2067669 RepID=UPI0035658DD8
MIKENSCHKMALVLGATGGIGGAIASALLRHGWHVRGLARDVSKASRKGPNAIEWIEGDAMRSGDVARAADGVSVLVHAVNPAGYRNWDRLVLPMIDNSIAAARDTRGAGGSARVVLPGTIYNYDAATTPVVDGQTEQRANSAKGKIRIALEQRLKNAAPEVPSLILRAGDFFGPGARSSWFSQLMVKSGKPVAKLVNPARGGGHSWAYLPDLAESFALLLEERERLSDFEVLQFEGLYDERGQDLIDGLSRVVGRALPVRRFPWWALKAIAPFGGFAREAAEIAPHWHHPLRLDNSRLVQLLGAEPRTKLDDALRATLKDMGCLKYRP